MTRLSAHVSAFRKTLADGGRSLKRIGFLLRKCCAKPTRPAPSARTPPSPPGRFHKEDLEAIREQALNLE
ncbi:MAG: hypothetical protein IPN71_08875 [Fibrobacteres bacterium]|nr:hypothetical protein [Fibrobacterota bacterium]